jgi:hypothetical protein
MSLNNVRAHLPTVVRAGVYMGYIDYYCYAAMFSLFFMLLHPMGFSLRAIRVRSSP